MRKIEKVEKAIPKNIKNLKISNNQSYGVLNVHTFKVSPQKHPVHASWWNTGAGPQSVRESEQFSNLVFIPKYSQNHSIDLHTAII